MNWRLDKERRENEKGSLIFFERKEILQKEKKKKCDRKPEAKKKKTKTKEKQERKEENNGLCPTLGLDKMLSHWLSTLQWHRSAWLISIEPE